MTAASALCPHRWVFDNRSQRGDGDRTRNAKKQCSNNNSNSIEKRREWAHKSMWNAATTRCNRARRPTDWLTDKMDLLPWPGLLSVYQQEDLPAPRPDNSLALPCRATRVWQTAPRSFSDRCSLWSLVDRECKWAVAYVGLLGVTLNPISRAHKWGASMTMGGPMGDCEKAAKNTLKVKLS